MSKWYILLWCGYELSIWFLGLHSWSWDHISGLILRWCIYDAYMMIFIRIRRSTKLEYTSSLLDDESLICYCCHMHKDHIIQLWCKIPIVLYAHVDRIVDVDDINKSWQMILSSRYRVLVVGDMMMMSSYLYVDTYVCWLMQIFQSVDTWMILLIRWLWCFSHMI